MAATLNGKENKAALCAACKWEGMTHIEAYNALFPDKVVTDESKINFVSKLYGEAKTLAEKHGLEMPKWKK